MSDLKRQFDDRGYVVLPDLMTGAELAELSEMSDRLLDGQLKPDLAYNGETPDDFYTFWEPGMKERQDLPRRLRVRLMSWMCYHHSWFWEFACRPAIAGTMSELFGGGDVQIFSDTVFMKPPRHGIEAAPHQDTAFWPKLSPNAILFWMAIDPATIENGCLHIVPRSHRTDLPHRTDPVQGKMLEDCAVRYERADPDRAGPGLCADHGQRLDSPQLPEPLGPQPPGDDIGVRVRRRASPRAVDAAIQVQAHPRRRRGDSRLKESAIRTMKLIPALLICVLSTAAVARDVPNLGVMLNDDGDLLFLHNDPEASIRATKASMDAMRGTPIKTFMLSVGAGSDILHYDTKVASIYGWRETKCDEEVRQAEERRGDVVPAHREGAGGDPEGVRPRPRVRRIRAADGYALLPIVPHER